MKEYSTRQPNPRKKYLDCQCGHKWNDHEASMKFWRNFEGNCKICMCPLYKESQQTFQKVDEK